MTNWGWYNQEKKGTMLIQNERVEREKMRGLNPT